MTVSRPKADKGRFDLHEIKRLLEMIERSPITEFELVDKDLKIRISKNGSEPTVRAMVSPHVVPLAVAHATAPAAAVESPPAPAEARRAQLVEIKSPMVGTFYRAPGPDAEPYVHIGDMIEPGRVLCVVEAMKLMNELEAEVHGRIVEICAENAQPVEFGQVLFRVESGAA